MTTTNKARLNLYLDKDLIDFAKKLCYVTGHPISKMLEEYLRQQKKLVANITPFQWLSDPEIKKLSNYNNEYLDDLEAYLNNREEEDFCLQNPDHPRARMRQQLLDEYQRSFKQAIQQQKEKERKLIQRWMEVFPADGRKLEGGKIKSSL